MKHLDGIFDENSQKRKTNVNWFVFTGSSRQTTLVLSEGGSVENIDYKKRNSRRSQRSFTQEETKNVE